ncbi:hypothetical protein KDE13_05000 [Campylobacter sp. faydin G-140]|uniref:hypothetical protein n=1 Tax=Campylobacter anatolicus TaxID=2829105 RepID=UPI001BA1C235|nr:hypothetical protein [Campylobacter anatolicus]MBR8465715.1 hypothetical protein [Campylobacter anatolicus]
MKKILILIISLIFISGIFATWYVIKSSKSEDSLEFANFSTTLEPLSCDMNIQPCEVSFGTNKFIFELEPRPIYPMKPINLKISGAVKLNLKEPSLDIYGLNMNMGVIKAKLEPRGDDLVANIVLSACVINVMRYRFDVLSDGKKTGLYIDFDLKI